MTNRTILELHILQTVPPSNLNRDDTGSPKTAIYGGVRRARVSSQAWKRATRRAFDGLVDPSELGVRTRRVAELLAERIRERDASIEEAEAWALAAETIHAATGSKLETPKRRTPAKGDAAPAPESKYLMFLSAHQLDGLAELAVEGREDIKTYFKGKDNKTRARQVVGSRHSIGIALFGRMVADDADINVDAAAQVAHAISVHQVDNESDYYTAVDDHSNRGADDLGAGMIGTVEFNSATFYRYAALDVDLLGNNLNKGRLREGEPLTDPVRRAVEAFTEGFITSLPTGKLNTFGHHTLPDAVIVKLRTSRPVNFVAAFEQPCQADQAVGGHLREACERLTHYIPQVERAYGLDDARTWMLRVGPGTDPLAGLGTELPLRDLITAIGTEVARRLKGDA